MVFLLHYELLPPLSHRTVYHLCHHLNLMSHHLLSTQPKINDSKNYSVMFMIKFIDVKYCQVKNSHRTFTFFKTSWPFSSSLPLSTDITGLISCIVVGELVPLIFFCRASCSAANLSACNLSSSALAEAILAASAASAAAFKSA